MTLLQKLSPIAVGLLLAACGTAAVNPQDSGTGDTNTTADTGSSSTDAGSTDQDSGTPADTGVATDSGPTCAATVPSGNNYCTQPGCDFNPITLQQCDTTNTPYAFYGDPAPSGDYCNSTATVLVVAAGWCVPCMMEAPEIEANVTQAYRDRGVRVITVYAQDPDGSAPDSRNCNNWKTRYSLSSQMVIDPEALTSVYFPSQAYPAIIIVDKHGQIRDSYYGGGMTDRIGTVLDQILAEP